MRVILAFILTQLSLLLIPMDVKGQYYTYHLSPSNPVAFDINGSFIPFFIDELLVSSSAHISMGFDDSGTHGPCMSLWSFYDAYRGFRFTGIGYKVGPQIDFISLKIEGGMLFDYLNQNMNSYRVELKPGALVPYFRIHLGFRFRERFSWGGQLNWIPPTNAVHFTDQPAFSRRRTFESFYKAPNRHMSPGFFVGASLN